MLSVETLEQQKCQKSWETQKNLISRCFWTRNNRHHSDIGPTPVLRSSTRSHVRDQIGMPSLKKTPFDHVCFNVFFHGKSANSIWKTCDSQSISATLQESQCKFGLWKPSDWMLRSGQIVKAALGFFALKSQRKIQKMPSSLWCVLGSELSEKIRESSFYNHMTHACLSCNKSPPRQEWPLLLRVAHLALHPSQKCKSAIKSLRYFQPDLPNKKSLSGTYEVDNVDNTCDKLPARNYLTSL